MPLIASDTRSNVGSENAVSSALAAPPIAAHIQLPPTNGAAAQGGHLPTRTNTARSNSHSSILLNGPTESHGSPPPSLALDPIDAQPVSAAPASEDYERRSDDDTKPEVNSWVSLILLLVTVVIMTITSVFVSTRYTCARTTTTHLCSYVQLVESIDHIRVPIGAKRQE